MVLTKRKRKPPAFKQPGQENKAKYVHRRGPKFLFPSCLSSEKTVTLYVVSKRNLFY